MRKLLFCIALSVVAIPAWAQTDDAAYCAQLGALAVKYTGMAGGNGGTRPDLDTAEAINECQKGNTAAGIPVLEQKLRNSRISLPKR